MLWTAAHSSFGARLDVVQQRLPSLRATPITFGHRGARGIAPENTLEGFGVALDHGVGGLESDVWLTADGVPVLDHDGRIRHGRLGRSHPIGTVQRSQLPDHIPSLTDLYERCGTDFELSLDLKDANSGQRVIDVTREVDPSMVERLWLCSPTWQSLLPLRGQGAKLVDSTRAHLVTEGLERRAATLLAEGIDCLNMHHDDWTGGSVVLLHRFGLHAFGWDMQDDHILVKGLRMGLDGVYSDWPDRMMAAFAAECG